MRILVFEREGIGRSIFPDGAYPDRAPTREVQRLITRMNSIVHRRFGYEKVRIYGYTINDPEFGIITIGIEMVDSYNDRVPLCDDLRSPFRLTKLAPLLRRIPHLRWILVEGLPIGVIPKQILKIPGLIGLEFISNRIREIPADIALAHQLEVVSIIQPGDLTVPKEIGELTGLKYVELVGATIQNIPETLLHLPLLEFIRIDFGNRNHPFWGELAKVGGKEFLKRAREFIPRLLTKIECDEPLTEWDRAFPYYLLHAKELEPMCYKYPVHAASKAVLALIYENSLVRRLGKPSIWL